MLKMNQQKEMIKRNSDQGYKSENSKTVKADYNLKEDSDYDENDENMAEL